MLSIEHLKKHIDFSTLKEEFRKLGVNFVTAGVVGVFIYHYVGTDPRSLLWACGYIPLANEDAIFYGPWVFKMRAVFYLSLRGGK